MADNYKFPLYMADGIEVRSIEALRKDFDPEKVLEYYVNGKLLSWLKSRGLKEADDVSGLMEQNLPAVDIVKRLCEIFDADCSLDGIKNTDITDLAERSKRIEKLKEITDKKEIIDNIDSVAFSQEELEQLLKKGKTTIYLCNENDETFKIPGDKEGIKYIGVNNPKVDVPLGFSDKNITCTDVDFRIDEIISRANKASGKEVLDIWQLAAELGSLEAQVCIVRMFALAVMLQKGVKEKMNEDGFYYNYRITDNFLKAALLWGQKAAEQGSVEAQYHIANIYFYGLGVDENKGKAIEWYRRVAESAESANSFSRSAQYTLGRCLYYGDGIKINYKEAVKYLTKAAERGDEDAQVCLGVCYHNGEGVERNYSEAIKWFRKAALQGDDYAIKTLKELGESL